MSHPVSRLATNGRTTIPKPVRDALGLRPGDTILYEIGAGYVVLWNADTYRKGYYDMLNRMFAEWDSPEDAEAFDDLLDKR